MHVQDAQACASMDVHIDELYKRASNMELRGLHSTVDELQPEYLSRALVREQMRMHTRKASSCSVQHEFSHACEYVWVHVQDVAHAFVALDRRWPSTKS